MQHGITQTSELVNIVDFFKSHIVMELETPNNFPVLKADAIKYTMTFRNMVQDTFTHLHTCLPISSDHLSLLTIDYVAAC